MVYFTDLGLYSVVLAVHVPCIITIHASAIVNIILFVKIQVQVYLGCVRIIQVDCPELFTMFRNSKDSTSQSRDSYCSTRHANCRVSCIR